MTQMTRIVPCHPIIRLIRDSDIDEPLFEPSRDIRLHVVAMGARPAVLPGLSIRTIQTVQAKKSRDRHRGSRVIQSFSGILSLGVDLSSYRCLRSRLPIV